MYKTVTPVVLLISCLLYQVNSQCVPDCGVNGVCDTTDDKCLCRQHWFETNTPCDTEGDPTTCKDGSSAPCDTGFLCDAANTCTSDCTSGSITCQNGETCLAPSDGSATRCHCDIGLTGTNCECVLADVDYDSATDTCWCKSGFGGADCTIPCDVSCTDGCTATAATDCIDADQCPDSPCQGGTCTSYRHDATASVKCRCNAGYTGAYCDKCVDATVCNAGNGTCTAAGDCDCGAGYAGQFCQHACDTACESCTMNDDESGAECSGAVRVLASLVLTLAAVLRAAF